MKKIYALLIIIMILMSACQPTPEGLIVQNKADDDLQEAIAQTATPIPDDVNASDGNVISETASAIQHATRSKEPIDYIEDKSSNASNTVTVEIDADVINSQPDNIPVAKIAPKELTEDEVKQMVQAFFGNSQLYSRDLTKEDYDEWILSKQLELNDEEKLKVYAADRNIEDLSEARNQIQEAIDRMKRERQSASDSRVTADYSELYSEHGFDLFIDTRRGFLGNVLASKDRVIITAFNDDNSYYLERDYISDTSIDLNSTDSQFQEAKQMANDLISEINVDSVLGDVYLVDDYDYIGGPNRQFYVFCFEMVINKTSIEHVLESGALTYYEYEIPREHTRLEVWIEDDQFVQLRYRMPMDITEVLNDNVAISIDYNQAIEFAKKYAYVNYVDTYGNFSEAKLNVTKIELIMVRTKEKENGDYIIVPAWNFSGTLSRKWKEQRSDADENGWSTIKGTYGYGDSLIVINALDGTTISLEHGY